MPAFFCGLEAYRHSFRMINWLLHILQGIGIGAANVIPGVSGGTMALIFGIYERLIEVASQAVRAGLSLIRLDMKGCWAGIRTLPWMFIIPLTAGIVIAPLLGARVIPEAMDAWPVQSRALFFGLILGSIAIPWIRMKASTVVDALLMLLAAAVAFYLSGLPATVLHEPSLLQYFIAGAVAICAMILPGVSGAFLLLVMGFYAPVLRAIDARDFVIVGVFLLGTFSGLGAFSVFMGWLLRSYHDQTMAVLVGLMAGSLRALWPWLGNDRTLLWYSGQEPLGAVAGIFAAGLLVSVLATVYELRRARRERTG